jgi:hypothetical protein
LKPKCGKIKENKWNSIYSMSLKRQRPLEYVVSDILYDFKLLMGKDSEGDQRVLNKADSNKVLGRDYGKAITSINCEEFNPHLYYDGIYWGSNEYNQLLEKYVGLHMEWYDCCIALLYIDEDE